VTARHALYWAPPAGSILTRLGEAWLGHSAEGRTPDPRAAVPGFAGDELTVITAEPRRYGLHATLKPPFRLAEGRSEAALEAALAAFCRTRPVIVAPPLRLKRIGNFLALVPGERAPEIGALAAACVEAFDGFRAAPAAGELARRRAARLTPAQEANLTRWGYPYVMDEFRFHVTLTGAITREQAERLEPFLASLFAPAMAMPLEIGEISLFDEPAPGAPFRLVRRQPFLGRG
jgi:putative phosphonate metabolism protein